MVITIALAWVIRNAHHLVVFGYYREEETFTLVYGALPDSCLLNFTKSERIQVEVVALVLVLVKPVLPQYRCYPEGVNL